MPQTLQFCSAALSPCARLAEQPDRAPDARGDKRAEQQTHATHSGPSALRASSSVFPQLLFSQTCSSKILKIKLQLLHCALCCVNSAIQVGCA